VASTGHLVEAHTWWDGAPAVGEHPVPGDNGQHPESRQRPSGNDEQRGVARCSASQILQRVGDGAVAVDAQHEQVEYRRRAGRVVDDQPELTDDQTELPGDGKYVDGADRHNNKSYCEIGRRQAHNEHVTHLQRIHIIDRVHLQRAVKYTKIRGRGAAHNEV